MKMSMHIALDIEEILEHVLKFANGRSLGNAELVCTKWKYSVENLNKKSGIWRLCCENEISQDNLFDILSKLYPRHWLSKNSQNICWKTVYKHWNQWRLIPKWVYIILKIPFNFTKLCKIYCVKSSGEWLFVGTDSCLLMYNTENRCSKHISTKGGVIRIEPYVTEMKENTFLPSHISDYLMKTCCQHNCLLLELLWMRLSNIYVTFNLHSGAFSDWSYGETFIHNNIFIKIIPQSNMTDDILVSCLLHDSLQEKDCIVNILKPDSLFFELPQNSHIELANYYKDMLSFCHTHRDRTLLLTFKNFKEPYVPELHFTSKTTMKDRTLHYNWHCKVNILANFSTMEIHVYDKCITYYPLQEIGNSVTAAFLYQSYLFLGTDLGNLYLHEVRELKSLLTLELKQPIWTINITDDMIKGIEVIECSPRPKIVCHTVCNIFMIEFQTS